MKTLNLLLTFIFISVLSISFASNGPLFIVEENGNEYVMYLKLDNTSNVNSISIIGNYSKNGVSEKLDMTMSELDVAIAGNGMTQIHALSSTYDKASYTIKIFDKDGYVLEYPMVQITLSDFNSNLAIAE